VQYPYHLSTEYAKAPAAVNVCDAAAFLWSITIAPFMMRFLKPKVFGVFILPLTASVVAVAAPNTGVTKVGLVAKTFAPVPVSSVKAVANCADVNEPKEAALPTEVIAPVKLALVVTLLAVKAVAVPEMFVPTKAVGVPSAGVTSVGDVARTNTPVPVPVYSAAVE
jgi:hypothetical protein